MVKIPTSFRVVALIGCMHFIQLSASSTLFSDLINHVQNNTTYSSAQKRVVQLAVPALMVKSLQTLSTLQHTDADGRYSSLTVKQMVGLTALCAGGCAFAYGLTPKIFYQLVRANPEKASLVVAVAGVRSAFNWWSAYMKQSERASLQPSKMKGFGITVAGLAVTIGGYLAVKKFSHQDVPLAKFATYICFVDNVMALFDFFNEYRRASSAEKAGKSIKIFLLVSGSWDIIRNRRLVPALSLAVFYKAAQKGLI